MFDDVLRRILEEVEGARCVVLAGLDGMVVAAAARDGGPPPDFIAASMGDLYRKAGSALQDTGMGTPRELTVGGGTGHVVLREVTSEYVLAMALEPGSSLGRARFELRKAASVLESELV